MQGTSGTYAFNGVALLLPPTEAGWVSRDPIGITGNARPTYPALRKYTMSWDLMDMASFAQIQNAYSAISSTGTVIVDLPKYGTTPYQFYSYTGCTLQEPEVGNFYEQHVTDVTLIILRIK